MIAEIIDSRIGVHQKQSSIEKPITVGPTTVCSYFLRHFISFWLIRPTNAFYFMTSLISCKQTSRIFSNVPQPCMRLLLLLVLLLPLPHAPTKCTKSVKFLPVLCWFFAMLTVLSLFSTSKRGWIFHVSISFLVLFLDMLHVDKNSESFNQGKSPS